MLLLAVLSLAGCERGPPPPPVAVFIDEHGKPASWKFGDRVRVEGRISRTGGGDYLINNITGSGEGAHFNCLLMRDPDSGWSVRWLQAILLADSDKLVAITGVSTEGEPRFPVPGGEKLCIADIVMDGLTVL